MSIQFTEWKALFELSPWRKEKQKQQPVSARYSIALKTLDICIHTREICLKQIRRNVLHEGTSIDLAFLDLIISHLLVIMDFLCHDRFSGIV